MQTTITTTKLTCDRCGAMTWAEKGRPLGWGQISGRNSQEFDLFTESDAHEPLYGNCLKADLCESCTNGLMTWWELGKLVTKREAPLIPFVVHTGEVLDLTHEAPINTARLMTGGMLLVRAGSAYDKKFREYGFVKCGESDENQTNTYRNHRPYTFEIDLRAPVHISMVDKAVPAS